MPAFEDPHPQHCCGYHSGVLSRKKYEVSCACEEGKHLVLEERVHKARGFI